MPNAAARKITLDARSSRLVARLVKSGRYESEERAVRAAMRLLEAEEPDSAECVEGVRRGLTDAAAGREQPWDDFRKEFERKNGLKRRG